MDGKIYADIVIDIDAMVADLEHAYGRALPFAADIGYVNDQTLDFILAKASAYEGVLTRVITGEPEPEPVEAPAPAAEEKKEESKEESKPEEKAEESAAGLASLF
mgnify:FL=1